MNSYNDCSKSGLLLSCQMYLVVKNELNETSKNLKASVVILAISLVVFITGMIRAFPGSDLLKSEIVAGLVLLLLVGSLIGSFWNLKEFLIKNKTVGSYRKELFESYGVFNVEDKRVWFDINGNIKSVDVERIDEDFVKHLLTPKIRY